MMSLNLLSLLGFGAVSDSGSVLASVSASVSVTTVSVHWLALLH